LNNIFLLITIYIHLVIDFCYMGNLSYNIPYYPETNAIEEFFSQNIISKKKVPKHVYW